MKNVLDLICNYIKYKKFPDEIFYDKIVEFLIKEKGLYNYINKVSFYSKNKSINMQYSANNKAIYIYLNSLYDQIIYYILHNKQFDHYSEDDKYSFIIFLCLFILLHEIEHANQQKKMDINDMNLENKLLHLSTCENNNVIRKYYYYNHDFFPSERLANYYSIIEILELITEANINFPIIYPFFKRCYYSFLTKDYVYKNNVLLSPTLLFLKDIKLLGMTESTKLLDNDFNKLLSEGMMEDCTYRLKYGLPVQKCFYNIYSN